MIRNTFIYLFIIIAGFLVSCQREDQDAKEEIGVIIEDTENYFDTNIIGKVQDVQGQDLRNVRVSLGNQTDITSDYGVFLFNHIKTNSAGSLLTLSKEGYFDRYIFITKDAEQFTNIQTVLKEKTNPISFSSSSSEDIRINDQMSVQMVPDAFAYANGNSYSGQVQCFINVASVQGNIPFIDRQLGKGLLVKSSQVQFVFEAQDGSPLWIKKPLTLICPKGTKVGKLNMSKEKWVEQLSTVSGGKNQIAMESVGPYIIGQQVGMTKVKTRIVSSANEGVSFTQLDVNTGDEKWTFTPDQDGYVSFYAPANVSMDLVVKSMSGQLLAQKNITTAGESEKQEVPMVVPEGDLIAVKSDILSCEAPISTQDLVNVSLTGGQKTIHIYQSQNSQTFVMPFFHKIEKAMYFRGKQPKFSISFSGFQSQKVVEINAAPLCMEKISGFVNINDMPRFFDKNQYSIFREFVETLSISDISGFLISIPKVNGVGSYKPDAILFNHPEITDCIGSECMDMTVYIDTYSKPGEPVKVRLEGMIGNKHIKGEFVNILKN